MLNYSLSLISQAANRQSKKQISFLFLLNFWIYFKVSQKDQNNETPFDNSNLFSSWHSLSRHSDPFLLGLLISFFSPDIKTILPQKHNFCNAVTEPASVPLSGRHWLGHCLLFSPLSRNSGEKNNSNKETLFICCFSAVKNSN